MKKKLSISILQTDIQWCNRQKNIEFFDNKIKIIKNSDIVILPEMFDTGFCIEPNTIEGNHGKETLEWMIGCSKSNNISIGGSIAFKEEGKFVNRFYFVTPQGEIHYYDKKHLFKHAGEKNEFSSGNKHTYFDFNGWKIFLLVCYDLRFPVWSRNLVNYHLLIYVANWPDSRIEQWKSLLIARAIENQTYVVGVNRIGEDGNGFVYTGKSLIINPKGDIIYEAKSSVEDIYTAELDLDFLLGLREKFPVLEDADKFSFLD